MKNSSWINALFSYCFNENGNSSRTHKECTNKLCIISTNDSFVCSRPIMIRELHMLANRKPDWATRPPRAFWGNIAHSVASVKWVVASEVDHTGIISFWWIWNETEVLSALILSNSWCPVCLLEFWCCSKTISNRYKVVLSLYWTLFVVNIWLNFAVRYVACKLVQDEVEGRLYVLSFNQKSSNLPLNVVSVGF
jgi:hypothetical protein